MPTRTVYTRFFDSFDLPAPAGWDDKDGWCRRHWAPLAAIPDPRKRADTQRLASLDLMGVFAAKLRMDAAPLPVPARKLPELIRELGPVCCYVGDRETGAVIAAALQP